MSCHSSGSLEGGCPSSAEVIEDTEDFIQSEGLYSLFTAFERFPYLRDFLNYFGLIDFLFKFERFAAGNTCNWQHVQVATHKTGIT